MMRKIYLILIVGLFLLGQRGRTQSNHVFTIDAFIQQVKTFHPVARQADLLVEKATADLLTARGAFDPAFNFDNAGKSLGATNYYNYENAELKIPTASGLTIKGGYERSSGQYINPERSRGLAGYLGVELPLLNGFLTDKKRTALRQAKLFQQMGQQERQLLINDLLLEAYAAYWEWAGSYQSYRVYTDYLQIADKRTRLVSLLFRNGDRAMADTVEADVQLQGYRLLRDQALLELNKKTLELSTYLWSATGEPYQLPDGYVPDTLQFDTPLPEADMGLLTAGLQKSHPLLQVTRYKGRVLEAERRLKFQNLLPILNFKVNVLSKDYFAYKDLSAAYLQNNYKFGLQATLPLLLRHGRGEYKAVKLKLKENEWELSRKTWELETKLRQYHLDAIQLEKQIETAQAMFRSYRTLLRTEELKFQQGESSLFIINARESKLLEMQQKLIELQVKYLKSQVSLRWVGGIIR